MTDFEDLNMEELIKKQKELAELLEEIEEEKKIVLGQTGLHLPGHTVHRYEAEISEIKKKLAKLQKVLDNKL